MSIVGVLMSDADWESLNRSHALVKYQCRRCKRFYERMEGGAQYSCCVVHAFDECCHAFETEVHARGWRKKVRT